MGKYGTEQMLPFTIEKESFWGGNRKKQRERLGRMESRFSWDC